MQNTKQYAEHKTVCRTQNCM